MKGGEGISFYQVYQKEDQAAGQPGQGDGSCAVLTGARQG